jgi:hypothetical protein
VDQDQLVLVTFAVEAFFWLGAYGLIIWHAFRERIHGMPVVAMCGNISWEIILGVGLYPACPAYWADCPAGVMGPLTLAAALLDGVILYTILRFGRDQFQIPWLRRYFPGLVFAGIALSFSLIYTFMTDVYTRNIYGAAVNGTVPPFLQAGLQGGIYTGWGLALMMGLLFIALITSRGDLRGQSFYIALFMLLGNVGAFLFDLTAASTMPALIYVLVAATLSVNAAYVLMVYRKARELGLNPLKHL